MISIVESLGGLSIIMEFFLFIRGLNQVFTPQKKLN